MGVLYKEEETDLIRFVALNPAALQLQLFAQNLSEDWGWLLRYGENAMVPPFSWMPLSPVLAFTGAELHWNLSRDVS